jgi:cytochrome oxidase Cu insertion factor (SCO1/SenC/PrrC family)
MNTPTLVKITLMILTLAVALGSAQEKAASTTPKKSEKTAPPEMTGLEVGKQAPPFTLKNQDGKEVELRDLLKQGPVALVFYRSADW